MSAVAPIILPSKAKETTPTAFPLSPLIVPDAIYSTPIKDDFSLSIPMTRPFLPAPQGGVFEGISKLYDVCGAFMNTNRSLIEAHLAKLKTLSHEHFLLFKQAAERTQSSLFWETLRKIGASIVAAFSFVFGLSVINSGGSLLVAGALISSGVLAITNLAFAETGMWDKVAEQLYPEDKKQREKFLLLVPSAIGLLSAGLGTAGGVAAWSGGAITFADKVTTVVNSTIHLTEGVVSLGEGISKARVHFTEAELQELNLKKFTYQQELDQFTAALDRMMKLFSKSHSSAARIIKLSTQSISEIMG